MFLFRTASFVECPLLLLMCWYPKERPRPCRSTAPRRLTGLHRTMTFGRMPLPCQDVYSWHVPVNQPCFANMTDGECIAVPAARLARLVRAFASHSRDFTVTVLTDRRIPLAGCAFVHQPCEVWLGQSPSLSLSRGKPAWNHEIHCISSIAVDISSCHRLAFRKWFKQSRGWKPRSSQRSSTGFSQKREDRETHE